MTAQRQGRPEAVCRAGRLVVACVTIALVHQVCGAVPVAHGDTEISQGPNPVNGGPSILNGYRRYNASCNHCHGPDGVGSSFGPSLIEAPLGEEAFRDVVLNGRSSGTSVMKGFANDPNIEPYVSDIYAYLSARTQSLVGRGRPRPGSWGKTSGAGRHKPGTRSP